VNGDTMNYTAEGLVREAANNGFNASERLILDWTSLGLLDQPNRHGLGRGKGSTAVWPENQRHLFLTLLAQRKQVNRVSLLCNVPVWLWLWWGDDHVPLRQVRKALATWGKSQGFVKATVSWERARRTAGLFIKQIGHPKATRKAREALQTAVAEMFFRGTFEAETLLPLVQRVFDPKGTGQPRGPAGGQMTPDDIVTMIAGRYAALRQIERIDESLFSWARFFYLAGLWNYQEQQPRFAADPDRGWLFEEMELGKVVADACLHLVTILGLALVRPPDESLENPETWKAHRLRHRITRTVMAGPNQIGVSGVVEALVEEDAHK
jgi:hypothetical protein